ncbi:hypothetical protein HID58_032895 [Brassica napus]|uniref:S-protein homolog n=1 Tax=Brassica napus TaxID=3708 RepID=A0ABQ8BXQ9_BRANA|nr:hypothetical protein HID58_032895 [Brassica napus]
MSPSSYQFSLTRLGIYPLSLHGFCKDRFNGTYKPVWLYNSQEFDDVTTTCEVFDYSTNAWRYVVTPASPCEIT